MHSCAFRSHSPNDAAEIAVIKDRSGCRCTNDERGRGGRRAVGQGALARRKALIPKLTNNANREPRPVVVTGHADYGFVRRAAMTKKPAKKAQYATGTTTALCLRRTAHCAKQAPIITVSLLTRKTELIGNALPIDPFNIAFNSARHVPKPAYWSGRAWSCLMTRTSMAHKE